MYSSLSKSYLFVFVKINFPGCSFSINVYSPFISSFLPSNQGFQQISPYFRLDKVGTSVISSIPTNLLCLYFIHVDLIQPFCRFQLNIQRTACCFQLHVLVWLWIDFYHKCLDSGYSSFQTAKLVNIYIFTWVFTC